jgi:HEAT repeat protein
VQIPEVNSIDHLADILLNPSENLFNRCRAMTSLRNLCIGQESTYCDSFTIIKVVQALTGAHQAQSTFLRYQLVLTLGQINHESTVPYLLYQLQNDYSEDSRVRAAAAEALAALTYENEVEPFMEDFKEDESELVRDFVALALRRAQESQQ